MKIAPDTIDMRIVQGPDRMALAIALFDMDESTDSLHSVTFRFEQKLGELAGVNVQLLSVTRESGNQTKLWCFRGFISQKAREKSGYALSGEVSGFYNLATRKGHMRLERT